MTVTTRIRGLFNHAGFLQALAIVIGLLFYGPAASLKPAINLVLAFAMTISLLGIPSRLFVEIRYMLKPTLLTILLNFVVIGSIMIGLAYVLLPDYQLWVGFVLLAAVPPAVAAVGFSQILGGNTRFALVGTIACYLAALILTPVICFIFLGTSYIKPVALLIVLAELIIAPIIISRMLRITPALKYLNRYQGPAINWSFMVATYIVIGVNHDNFFGDPADLLKISVIPIAVYFVFTYLLNLVARLRGVDKPNRLTLIFLGTTKNFGMAAAIALTFYGPKAAMSIGVAIALSALQLIYLTFWSRWK